MNWIRKLVEDFLNNTALAVAPLPIAILTGAFAFGYSIDEMGFHWSVSAAFATSLAIGLEIFGFRGFLALQTKGGWWFPALYMFGAINVALVAEWGEPRKILMSVISAFLAGAIYWSEVFLSSDVHTLSEQITMKQMADDAGFTLASNGVLRKNKNPVQTENGTGKNLSPSGNNSGTENGIGYGAENGTGNETEYSITSFDQLSEDQKKSLLNFTYRKSPLRSQIKENSYNSIYAFD